jgi:CDP-glycerol glycerophosphotransferase (TagB/SpsB family)
MGEKFSDNTRYIFQHISDNKEKYGINKAVWVTRDKKTYDTLCGMGYDVAKMHSIKSYYYHLKAGVHLICNMYYKTNQFNGDILGNWSYLATKIQLFHGVGIKACGKMRSNRVSRNNIMTMLSDVINDFSLLSPGGWNKCYFLATSSENKRIAKYDYGYADNRIIVAGYPRLCECPRLLPKEEEVINKIFEYRLRHKRIILYLPTFREDSAKYIRPYDIEGFGDFITKNNIFWMEKRHSADINQVDANVENVYSLNSNFDINVIYKYIDLLITDYSSAASDAIYWNKLTLEYCPDFKDYKNNERGFVAPFDKYHVNDVPITDSKVLFNSIIEEFNNGYNMEKQKKRHEVCTLLFGETTSDFGEIMKKIFEIVKM